MILAGVGFSTACAETIRGRVRDKETGQALAARIYLHSVQHGWRLVESIDGTQAHYSKDRRNGSVEIHSAVSNGRFTADVPAGDYELTVERGKEYFSHTQRVRIVDGETTEVQVDLRRWIDMNKLGWYSGDTHVHLTSRDLRTFVQAEHLNVAFPLTGWVTKAYVSPESSYAKQTGQVQRGLIRVDSSHIIQPMNTEWEIFTVDGKRHTLGAIFAIGHKEPFKIGAPPVRPIAAEARRQGALLELDKHNWPWSMMLIPIADVDLFELSNNHIWRTRFLFSTWYPEYAAKYMGVEMNDEGGFTERGWIEFGFQNYYTLLNCGMRLRPTAGTASGVHPVPVGFGRVYVEQPRGFSYKTWMSQLNAGRSFVTTGPMLFVTANERPAGARLKSDGNAVDVRLRGRAIGDAPFEKVEVVVNGRVVKSWKPEPRRNEQGAFGEKIDVQLNLESSSWVAVRCFDRRAEERTRFAHSSPFHVEIAGRPLRPRKADTEYLMGRVAAELKRHANVLPPEALGEYAAALEFYRQLHANAVDE